MASVRDSRVLTVLEADVGSLPLTPEDFYVLSRVDGKATADEVIAATGLGRVQAEAILRRLLELGAVGTTRPGANPTANNGLSSGARAIDSRTAALRENAQARRMRTLRAQMAGSRTVSPSTRGATASTEPSRHDVGAPEPGAPIDPPHVAVDDPRIELDIALSVDVQRHALALIDGVGQADPFTLLGITPIDDRKAVQRAYHATSRLFHPDRYFGKSLGGFAPRLSSLFEAITEAYESLLDDKRRGDLVEAVIRSQQPPPPSASTSTASRAAVAATDVVDERDARRRRAREQFERGNVERQAGRPGAAASLFRLAMELDSDDESYKQAWKTCLDEARRIRGARSFAVALRHVEIGQLAEAAHFFLDAAEADPSPVYLAEAAAAVADNEPHRARELALRALDALGKAPDLALPDKGRVHMCTAIAFLGGGQVHTARQQAQLASELIADDPRLCALLNSPKLT